MTTRPRDLALVTAGAVLWGTGGVTGALLAGQGMAPLVVASYRLGVGGGLLLLALALNGRLARLTPSRAVLGRVVVTGLLAAVYQGFYFLAVQRGSVAGATLVALGAAPVLVTAVTALLTRRAPSLRTAAAIALALAGLALLLGAPSTGGAAAALALLPAAAFATMTVLNARPVPGLGPLELTGTSFSLGALVLLPIAVLAGGALRPAGAGGVAMVLWLGLGPTALAYAAYFAGLRTVPATTASVVALLEPLVATAVAAVLLAQRPGPAAIVGGALLLAGIVVLRVAPTMAVGPRR